MSAPSGAPPVEAASSSAALDELSQHYGISRERVRQIEARAVERLRDKMTAAVAKAQADARDRQLVYAG